jgi:hypothetical protein
MLIPNIKEESEDNPKKFQNEFKAFNKRLGKHSAWFVALDNKKQWDLLFLWKNYKWTCSKNNQSISLKKFLRNIKSYRKFYVSIQRLRESTLNSILQK